jgi:hypothetical protein
LDLILYGALGLGVLGYTIFLIGREIWDTGSPLLIAAFVAFLSGTTGTLIRDLKQRRLSWASRGFLAAWVLCVALVIVAEFMS